MLLPEAMGKETSFVVVLMTVDSKLRMRDIEGFCDKLPPTNKQTKIRERTTAD